MFRVNLIVIALIFSPILFASTQSDAPPDNSQPYRPMPSTSAQRDQIIQLDSEVLDESREILIRRPARYNQSENSYHTIYVLDADWMFPVVADYLEYLSYWERIPPMLVVGIKNVDRNRDYIPKADPAFPNTGSGGQFVEFLKQELQPEINRRYRTTGRDIILGHSFGGVMALHSLFTEPSLFDAHIALGTSTWVADRVLFESAKAYFEQPTEDPQFVYMAVAEADGGQTVPAGEDMAQLFSEQAPASMEWSFTTIPETSHFTAVMPALHSAIEALFPSWNLQAELTGRLDQDNASAVDNWFSTQNRQLGWRFYPQSMELAVLANQLAAGGKPASARALLARLRSLYPMRPEVYAMSGYAETAAGDLEQAKAYAENAIRVGEQTGHYANRVQMYRNFVERVDALLAQSSETNQ